MSFVGSCGCGEEGLPPAWCLIGFGLWLFRVRVVFLLSGRLFSICGVGLRGVLGFVVGLLAFGYLVGFLNYSGAFFAV